jgi:hypothetical protein
MRNRAKPLLLNVGAVAGLAVLALTIAVVIGDRACFIAPM